MAKKKKIPTSPPMAFLGEYRNRSGDGTLPPTSRTELTEHIHTPGNVTVWVTRLGIVAKKGGTDGIEVHPKPEIESQESLAALVEVAMKGCQRLMTINGSWGLGCIVKKAFDEVPYKDAPEEAWQNAETKIMEELFKEHPEK